MGLTSIAARASTRSGRIKRVRYGSLRPRQGSTLYEAAQDRLSVLYVGGLGRSGSTLLERLVGQFRGAVALGEVVHLWQRGLRDNERCGCGKPFRSCEFWSAVGKEAFGGWDGVDADAVLALKRRVDRTRFVPILALPSLPARFAADVQAYVSLYERVYAAVLQITSAEVIIDSSKHASLAYCLRHSSRLDMKVIHVVRDSPAVAYSWSKSVRRPEAADGSSMMPRYSLGRVGARWITDNLMLDLLDALGTRRVLVRYEDFVADPRLTLQRLAVLTGVAADTAPFLDVEGRVANLVSAHTVAGNPMRFRTGPLEVRRDDDWREQLRPWQRRTIKAATLPVRFRFGYVGPSCQPPEKEIA